MILLEWIYLTRWGPSSIAKLVYNCYSWGLCWICVCGWMSTPDRPSVIQHSNRKSLFVNHLATGHLMVFLGVSAANYVFVRSTLWPWLIHQGLTPNQNDVGKIVNQLHLPSWIAVAKFWCHEYTLAMGSCRVTPGLFISVCFMGFRYATLPFIEVYVVHTLFYLHFFVFPEAEVPHMIQLLTISLLKPWEVVFGPG